MLGKVGACIEWAAEYTAHANPSRGAINVSWMAANPRCFQVRRRRPDGRQDIHLLPCTVTRRSRPLSFLRGKWKVATHDDVVPTGAEKHVQAALLRDIFGPLPFRPVAIDPGILQWNDGTVRLLAQSIYERQCFDRLPILADALEDA
jgi:hypothetical protein